MKLNNTQLRSTWRTARKITSMIQGTMGLEGQGLSKSDLRSITKRTFRELASQFESNPAVLGTPKD